MGYTENEHTFTAAPMKKNSIFKRISPPTVAVLAVCAMASAALVAELTISTDSTTRSTSTNTSTQSSSSKNSSVAGATGNDDCYLQVVTCPTLSAACATQPYAVTLKCADPRCVAGQCINKKVVDDRQGFMLQEICTLRTNPCPAYDVNCYATSTISRIDCEDDRCEDHEEYGHTCEKTTAMTDLAGVIVGLTADLPVVESEDTSGDNEKSSASSQRSLTTLTRCPDGWTLRCSDGNLCSCISQTVTGQQNDGEDRSGPSLDEDDNDDNQRTGEAAGCFDQNGFWTTDRTRCAADQSRYFGPIPTVVQTSSARIDALPLDTSATTDVYRQAIDEKFVPPSVLDERQRTLIASASTALERLDLILGGNLLPEEDAAQIRAAAESLRATLSELNEGMVDARALEQAAEDSRAALADAQEILTEVAPAPREPSSLLQKFDHIFLVLPEMIILLQNEQVPLTQDIIAPYGEGYELYAELRPACESDPDECVRLQPVLDTLTSMMDGVRSALTQAGKSYLEENIRALFQRT